ncbi:MAG: right-handed parallel beta-helix repeat-containing protein [Ruminococcus sp.]|nr:right-handed parallel beta-helix repeat-containing protein [Ruminococcus sp.]
MKGISLKLFISTALVFCISAAGIGLSPQADIEAFAKGSEITVDVSGGSSIGTQLQSALDEAAEKATAQAPVTVKIPAGEYKLEKSMHIYSNTYLDASGCTIKSDGSLHNLLMIGTTGTYKNIPEYNSSKAVAGYKALGNIRITGGKWIGNDNNEGTFFRLAHATNVTLEKMDISGGNRSKHIVEIAAINGFYVRNCKFHDYQPLRYMDGHFECIQIDTACSDTTFKQCYLDGLPSKNIEITGCSFKNVSRGLGTHSQLVGCYHDNVKITDNTFTNVAQECIVALNYTNCTISRNTISKCGGGILVQNGKFLPDSGKKVQAMYTTVFNGTKAFDGKVVNNVNTVVSDNDINVVYTGHSSMVTGIRVHGLYLDKKGYKGQDGKALPYKNYYISGVTVKNNTITTGGNGIYLDDVRNTAVTGNTITQKGVSKKDPDKSRYDGVTVNINCRRLSVTNNTISGFKRDGMLFMGNSSASEIAGNIITGVRGTGLHFCDKSGGGDIKGNTITSAGEHGILINTGSTAKRVKSNKISNCKGTGIYANSGSAISGGINTNTVKKAGGNGIALGDGSSAAEIVKNKISSSGNQGIGVYSSNVAKNISRNKISGAKANGIMLNTGSKAKGIINNTVSKVKGTGIYLYDKCTVKAAISGNVITNAGQHGVFLNTGSKAGAITGNTVKTAGGSGIYLYDKSGVSGDIAKNKLSGCGDNGIFLNTGCKAGKVFKNKISSSGNDGINVIYKSSTGAIKSNTITASKNSGIVLNTKSCASSITSNTVNTSAKYGIFLYEKSAVKGRIYSNKIKKAYNGISVAGASRVAKGIVKNKVSKAASDKIFISRDSRAKIKKK